MDSYKDCEIENYEFMATLDNKTSVVCRELDGKIFPVKDAVPGKNYPPMHPNCRSTTVCAFDDDKVTKRVARDSSGKSYEVPSNMTYHEWEKQHAEGVTYADFGKSKIHRVIDVLYDMAHDLKHPLLLRQIPQGREIIDMADRANNKEAALLFKHMNQIKFVNLKPKSGSSCINGTGKIRLESEKALINRRGSNTTGIHEIAHAIDNLTGNKSNDAKFRTALNNDFESTAKALIDSGACDTMESVYKYVTQSLNVEDDVVKANLHSVSDILEAVTNGKVMGSGGHLKSYPDYWTDENITAEAYAHFYEASLTENEAKQTALKQMFPTAYERYEVLLDEQKGNP